MNPLYLMLSSAWYSWIQKSYKSCVEIWKTSPDGFLFQSSSVPTILFPREISVIYLRPKIQTKKDKTNATIHNFHAWLVRWEILTEGGCTYSDQMDNRATDLLSFSTKLKVKYLREGQQEVNYHFYLYSERMISSPRKSMLEWVISFEISHFGESFASK